MEFVLPTELKDQLKVYDPNLRRIARLEEEAKRKANVATRNTSPLGKVKGLIPEHIVPAKAQERAVDHINKMPVNRRFWAFTRPVQDAAYPVAKRTRSYGYHNDEGERLYETFAIIYHFESRWIAAWLMPKDDPALYGVSYTYRDTPSTIQKLSTFTFGSNYTYSYHFPEELACVERFEQKIGRTTYVTHRATITEDLIKTGYSSPYWLCSGCDYYKKKSKEIVASTTVPFEQTLSTRVPHWNESGELFERVKTSAAKYLLVDMYGSYFSSTDSANSAGIDLTTWQPSADTVIDIFLKNRYSHYEIDSKDWDVRLKVCTYLKTPKLKAWVQELCDDFIEKFNDGDVTTKDDIGFQWRRIRRLFEHLEQIVKTWKEIPIDLIHNHFDELLEIECQLERSRAETRCWLADHMPLKSYLHLLTVFREKAHDEQQKRQHPRSTHNFDNGIKLPIYRFTELEDTISMLNVIFAAQQTISPPKRWRISEFHEHVQIKAWTISNPNVDLPQDLFPKPVHTDVDGTKVVLLQPINTHQLGQWGQAVRNCVGRASSYADEVKKKQAFLVLGLVDGRPTFTIQLTMQAGVLTVKQIVGYANACLSDEQRTLINAAFKQALQIRARDLSNTSLIEQD